MSSRFTHPQASEPTAAGSKMQPGDLAGSVTRHKSPLGEAYNCGDRELLRRFSLDSDEEAFAEVVRRYERLVMSVCRRVIGSGPEADDAFQATFITLARKPKQIRKIESLSSWLYSVAWRISVRLVRARRKNPVQPLSDEQTAPANDPLQQIAAHQHATILDEELQTLPNKYRDVLVMTYFAEQTSQQIADQLDVSKGTVDGRIRQARNMLRVKLARRGVGVGVLVAAASLLKAETAAASPTLVSSTIELGTQTLSQSVPGTADTSHIEPLVRPEITSMIGTKSILSSLAGIVALAGVAGMSGGQEETGTAEKSSAVVVDTRNAVNGEKADSLPTPGKPISVAVVQPAARAIAKPVSQQPGSQPGPQSARFSPYPTDALPAEKWLYETLDKSIPSLNHKQGTPLNEVLADLAAHYSKNSDGQTMRIWPDRLALEEVQIEQIENIFLSRDVELSNISLRSALKLILESLDGLDEPLTVVVQNEVLMLTTKSRADSEENFFIRTYNVAALLNLEVGMAGQAGCGGGPSGGFGGGGGGMGSGGGLGGPAPAGGSMGGGSGFFSVSPQLGGGSGAGMGPPASATSAPNLVNVVIDMTSPPALWQDFHGEGGTIALLGDKLVVRQSAAIHREIVQLLNLLTEEE
ncbi:MAG: RNA polymerase sigma factor [Planctomycetaceae bacterium]